MGISDCKVIDLPKIIDLRGKLTFIESNKHIPFDMKRIFYMYDVPTVAYRGSHSHRTLHQFLICLSGSFDVEIDDGFNKSLVHLNRLWSGLHIPPLIWASEINFAPGSICLVIASDFFDESDYILDYNEFLEMVGVKEA